MSDFDCCNNGTCDWTALYEQAMTREIDTEVIYGTEREIMRVGKEVEG